MSFVPSHLNALNHLILGHPKKLPTLFYGPPSAGKSILMNQLSYDFLKESNVLLFDTEGGLDRMVQLWKTKLDQRFNIKTTVIKNPEQLNNSPSQGTVYIIEARHIKNILAAHGYDVELKISDGAKIDVKLKNIKRSRVEELVDKCNVRYLVYDSLSNPLKTTFVGGRVNFPGRADAINLWLSSILAISDDYDIVIYGTSHRSVDPTNPYARPHITGGSTIQYNFKVAVYVDPSKSTRTPNVRKLYVARFFNTEPWKRVSKIELTDNGYIDVEGGEK